MYNRFLKSIVFLFVMLIIYSSNYAFSQNKNFVKLMGYYKDKKYEKCYKVANGFIEDGENVHDMHIFKAIAFLSLDKKHKLKSGNENWILDAMDIFNKSKEGDLLGSEDKKTLKFYIKAGKKLQKKAYKQGKKHYKKGRKDEAFEYFDKIHEVCDNSSDIYKNNFGNDVVKADFEKYLGQKGIKNLDIYNNNKDFAEWNNPKYRVANTVIKVTNYTETEKTVFELLNLMKMNPRLFYKTYVKTFIVLICPEYVGTKYSGNIDDASIKSWAKGNPHVSSLIDDMKKLTKKPILNTDEKLFKSAECWAIESSRSGATGHERERCEKFYTGESCYYINIDDVTAAEIVLKLLLDSSDENFANRQTLSNSYKTLGIAIRPHSKFKMSAVLDFGE